MKQSSHGFHELSDEAIDQALSTYAAAEFRPGLEARVMKAVAAAGNPAASGPSSTRLWSWCIAASSIAVALCLTLWTHSRSATDAQFANATNTSETKSQQAPRPLAPEAFGKGQARRALLPQKRTSTNRKPNSNTAVGLRSAESAKPNEQERLLAKLSANGAGAELVLPTVKGRPFTPVENQPIEIPPLTTEPISIAPIRIAALQPLPTPTR